MTDTYIALFVFTLLFGAVQLGMLIGARLPQHHQTSDTKDAVRLGMGTVATMTALILGLLVASEKSDFDTERAEVTQLAARVMYLDRVLDDYGTDSAKCRVILRGAVTSAVARIWPTAASGTVKDDPSVLWTTDLPNSVHALVPQNDEQRAAKAQAEAVISEIGQIRWLLVGQSESSISSPLIALVISWLTIFFLSLGLFAPRNATSIVAQLMAAYAIAGAIYLIIELDKPFSGYIRIPSEAMVNALNQLSR